MRLLLVYFFCILQSKICFSFIKLIKSFLFLKNYFRFGYTHTILNTLSFLFTKTAVVVNTSLGSFCR